jgi:hypothetical protein
MSEIKPTSIYRTGERIVSFEIIFKNNRAAVQCECGNMKSIQAKLAMDLGARNETLQCTRCGGIGMAFFAGS